MSMEGAGKPSDSGTSIDSEDSSNLLDTFAEEFSSDSDDDDEEVEQTISGNGEGSGDSQTKGRGDGNMGASSSERGGSSGGEVGSGSGMSASVGEGEGSGSEFDGTNNMSVAEFGSVEEAYAAYAEYAKVTGFAVRKGDAGKDADGNIVRKFFYCNKQGVREKKHYERVDRKRPHKSETRTNCNARYVVHLDRDSGTWKMRYFFADHNHELAPPMFTNVMDPQRVLRNGEKAHIHSLHEAGVQTTQIMGFFAYLAGGYQNLQFVKKDLYNYLDEVRKSRIVEGDAAAAISYLKGKTELDPLAFVEYTYCAENHLGNLFWADGGMQDDYECFGDVLAFDLMYKKNLYNRPLVIFSGSNHHRQTIIFGFGLLEDEKIESYKWLLGCFLEVMRGKEPMVVVTNGDESMREAIRTEFPNVRHRLCSWHLARNAVMNIKEPEFCRAFMTAMYGKFEVEEFEDFWDDMVCSFGLENNDWIAKTYEKRCNWANAYLRDTFCAGVRTTSRCEGINSSLKKFIKSGSCLLELVENLDRVVKEYRNNEFMADFRSFHGEPVITTGLASIERALSKVYTREIFYEVKKQIEGVSSFLVLHKESFGCTEKFMLRKFRKPDRVYSVLFDGSCDKFECSCKLWNTVGIPCSHIFCAMREKDMEEFPKRLILRRWCKDAKCHDCAAQEQCEDPERAFRMRYGSLWSACMHVCFMAAQEKPMFEKAWKDLGRMARELEAMCPSASQGRNLRKQHVECDLRDPKIVRLNGAPKCKGKVQPLRRCRRCHGVGHDRRNCTETDDGAEEEGMEEMEEHDELGAGGKRCRRSQRA